MPLQAQGGLWHIRNFTYKGDLEDNVYGSRSNLVNAGNRILVDGILPEGPPLMTTDDDGASWTAFWQDRDNGSFIVGLDFVGEVAGWMLRADGTLLSTIDGGRSWKAVSKLSADAAGHVLSMDSLDGTSGFLVGEKGSDTCDQRRGTY